MENWDSNHEDTLLGKVTQRFMAKLKDLESQNYNASKDCLRCTSSSNPSPSSASMDDNERVDLDQFSDLLMELHQDTIPLKKVLWRLQKRDWHRHTPSNHKPNPQQRPHSLESEKLSKQHLPSPGKYKLNHYLRHFIPNIYYKISPWPPSVWILTSKVPKTARIRTRKTYLQCEHQ